MRCPKTCGHHHCLRKTLWVIADSLCGHKQPGKGGGWNTFYINSALSGDDVSSPVRRYTKGGLNDVIELPYKSWTKCHADPCNPTGNPICSTVGGDTGQVAAQQAADAGGCAAGAAEAALAVADAEMFTKFVRATRPVSERRSRPPTPLRPMFVQSPEPCDRVSRDAHHKSVLADPAAQREFDRRNLRGFATAPGAAGVRHRRYFDLCGLFGNIVTESPLPSKIRFRVSLGPHQPKCGGLAASLCAHPRLQDLPSQASANGTFPEGSAISDVIKQSLLTAVKPLNAQSGFVSDMMSKFDASVRVVLALGAGDAREVLWDQNISLGKAQRYDHSLGNLTLTYLPAGIAPLVNATDNARALMQKKLATLFVISGNKQVYIKAMRGALEQAEQAVSAIPQLASMLRGSGVDMTAFIDQVSVLTPDVRDASKKFSDSAQNGDFPSNTPSSSSMKDYVHGLGLGSGAVAAGDALGGLNGSDALANTTIGTTDSLVAKGKGARATDEFRKNPEVLASVIEQLPELGNGTAAWSNAKQTLFTQNYIFDELVDLALSVVPVRVQVTCFCDGTIRGELPMVTAEGVLDEQHPQRVWFHAEDSSTVVFGFVVRHELCCDADDAAAMGLALTGYGESADAIAADAYHVAKSNGLYIFGSFSAVAIIALTVINGYGDGDGWSMPMPVNFMALRAQSRTVAFAIGTISVFLFDFIFGILGFFGAKQWFPSGEELLGHGHFNAPVSFIWCMVLALILTPLPSALQSKNRRGGAWICLALSLVYIVYFGVMVWLGSSVTAFEALKWVPSLLSAVVLVGFLLHQLFLSDQEPPSQLANPYLSSHGDSDDPSMSFAMTEMGEVPAVKESSRSSSRSPYAATDHNSATASSSYKVYFRHVANLLKPPPKTPEGAAGGGSAAAGGAAGEVAGAVPLWKRPFFAVWDSESVKILTKYAAWAVQLHPDGGQSDFARSPARAPHGAYV